MRRAGSNAKSHPGVYVSQKVIDRKELEIYWSTIGPTLEGYQAKRRRALTFDLLIR